MVWNGMEEVGLYVFVPIAYRLITN
jgi:hypothetical protein